MKLLYTTFAILIFRAATAQTWIADTVTMQPGYQNEIYYSLENDEQAQVEIRNWDLAFTTNLFEVTVLSNPVNGVTVYKTPYGVSGFDLLDTAGYTNWLALYNEFHEWSTGTFFHAADTSVTLDYGWGNYNPVTHVVNGTRVFLLKLEQNSTVSFKKFYVVQKDLDGNWEFRIADVDGSSDLTRTLDVANYSQKLFSYYAIGADEFLDREPNVTSWDLLFTRYFTAVGPDMFYPVTGVLMNKETEAAKAEDVDVNTVLEVDYAGIYSDDISTVGYDWKTFNGLTYDVQDSLVYFVKTQNNDVFKLRFISFEADAGTFVFEKSQVFTSVNSIENALQVVDVFPNPASTQINVLVNASHALDADLVVYNVLGEIITKKKIKLNGLSKETVDTSNLPKGIYMIAIENGNALSRVKRFVKQ